MSSEPARISSFLVSLALLALSFSPLASPARAEIDAHYLGSAPGRFNSIEALDIDGDCNVEIVFGNYEGMLTIL